MKKVTKFFLFAFIIVTGLFHFEVESASAAGTGSDEILDSKLFNEDLYQVLLKELKIKEITIKAAEEVEELDLQGENLESINGLEYFKNLKILDLSSNSIQSIEQLTSLSKLEELDLGNNKLKIIPDIKKLTKLNPEKTNFSPNEIEYKYFKDNLPEHLLKAKNCWLYYQLSDQSVNNPYSVLEGSAGKKDSYYSYSSEVIRDTQLEVKDVTEKYKKVDIVDITGKGPDLAFTHMRVFQIDAHWDDILMHPVSFTLKLPQFNIDKGTKDYPAIIQYQVLKIEGEKIYVSDLKYTDDEITFTVNSSGIYVIGCHNSITEPNPIKGGDNDNKNKLKGIQTKEKPITGTSKSTETPKSTSSVKKSSPKTGDNKNPYIYLLMIVFSTVLFLERLTWEMKVRKRIIKR